MYSISLPLPLHKSLAYHPFHHSEPRYSERPATHKKKNKKRQRRSVLGLLFPFPFHLFLRDDDDVRVLYVRSELSRNSVRVGSVSQIHFTSEEPQPHTATSELKENQTRRYSVQSGLHLSSLFRLVPERTQPVRLYCFACVCVCLSASVPSASQPKSWPSIVQCPPNRRSRRHTNDNHVGRATPADAPARWLPAVHVARIGMRFDFRHRSRRQGAPFIQDPRLRQY